MNPQIIPDPSGRYGRYLHQWNRYTTIRGEWAAARSIIEQVQSLRRLHRAHRHEMTAQGQAPRWWPFTTRRQEQAHYAARRAMDAVETTTEQINALSNLVEKLTTQKDEAHRAAMDLRTEWEAECEAREHYEAGGEPRDHTERGLFAEFRKQDARGGQGPEGRRMHEALNRFNRSESARTTEEQEWYHEWHELEGEKVPTISELIERRQAERDYRANEDDTPF